MTPGSFELQPVKLTSSLQVELRNTLLINACSPYLPFSHWFKSKSFSLRKADEAGTLQKIGK
ncbi:MAG: hypothetical protein P8N19_11150 [Flavobacteriales bacterium]|nr:hypothetical protein [Flavobacteriales bacterium]MDG1766424.1 hypothetical protein [Flavobacteriales bacterium]